MRGLSGRFFRDARFYCLTDVSETQVRAKVDTLEPSACVQRLARRESIVSLSSSFTLWDVASSELSSRTLFSRSSIFSSNGHLCHQTGIGVPMNVLEFPSGAI